MNLITISQMVEQNAAKYATAVAFQMKKDGVYRRLTYRQAAEMTENLALKLRSLDIRPGDRVALLSENCLAWPLAYLGIILARVVVVPLDAQIEEETLQYLLQDSGCKAIIISAKFTRLVLHLKSQLPALKFIIEMEKAEDEALVLSFERAVNVARVSTEVLPEAELDDLAAIVYTSGTTGVAKGAMLTHRNIMSNVLAVYSQFEVGPHDNFLSVLPLHHTFECTAGFLAPFYAGAKITYAESLKSYHLVANMQETGVTIMCGVPLLFRLFYEGIRREVESKGWVLRLVFWVLCGVAEFCKRVFKKNVGARLFPMIRQKLGGKLRFWVAGGAAMDPQVIEGFAVFGITLLQGFGLTEAAPIVSACTLEHNKIGSVGKPLPQEEVKIVNPDHGGIGEIAVRGPNVMRGYFKRPDLTAEVIKEGWLYTGDLGCLDKQGYLYITGRSKNLIVTGAGVNVYPEELEAHLGRIPFIKEACVLGVKLAAGVRQGGEAVAAVVVPDEEYFQTYLSTKGLEATPTVMEEMIRSEIQKLNERLSECKRIVEIKFVWHALPKTSTRKVKRFELRKELSL